MHNVPYELHVGMGARWHNETAIDQANVWPLSRKVRVYGAMVEKKMSKANLSILEFSLIHFGIPIFDLWSHDLQPLPKFQRREYRIFRACHQHHPYQFWSY